MISHPSAHRSVRVAFARRRTCGLAVLITLLMIATPASSQDTYQSAEEAYSAGAKLINTGKVDAAREPLEAALKLAKTDAFRLKVNRALLVPYRELREIEPMQKAAEFIIANSDQAAERSLARGTLLAFIHKRDKMDAAVDEYEKRLKKSPEDRTLLFLLTEAYATYKKDPNKSAEHAEKLAAVEKKLGKGKDVAGQAQLAQQYAKAGKLKEAAELYEAIAPLDAKLEAWHLKEAAAVWLKAGERARAILAARKSAGAAPENRSEQLTYFWHRGLADVFLEAGEPALAIPHYEQAIASTKIEGYLKDSRAKLQKAQADAKK